LKTNKICQSFLTLIFMNLLVFSHVLFLNLLLGGSSIHSTNEGTRWSIKLRRLRGRSPTHL